MHDDLALSSVKNRKVWCGDLTFQGETVNFTCVIYKINQNHADYASASISCILNTPLKYDASLSIAQSYTFVNSTQRSVELSLCTVSCILNTTNTPRQRFTTLSARWIIRIMQVTDAFVRIRDAPPCLPLHSGLKLGGLCSCFDSERGMLTCLVLVPQRLISQCMPAILSIQFLFCDSSPTPADIYAT